MVIVTMLILSIHENGRHLHLPLCSSISFFKKLKFYCRGILPFWWGLFLDISLKLLWMGIFPQYHSKVCFLLVHREDNDLFNLILYHLSLLKIFILFGSFLVEYFGILCITAENRDNLTSFPTCMPFISFFCLTSLGNSWRIILKRSL